MVDGWSEGFGIALESRFLFFLSFSYFPRLPLISAAPVLSSLILILVYFSISCNRFCFVIKSLNYITFIAPKFNAMYLASIDEKIIVA